MNCNAVAFPCRVFKTYHSIYVFVIIPKLLSDADYGANLCCLFKKCWRRNVLFFLSYLLVPGVETKVGKCAYQTGSCVSQYGSLHSQHCTGT